MEKILKKKKRVVFKVFVNFMVKYIFIKKFLNYNFLILKIIKFEFYKIKCVILNFYFEKFEW